MKLKRKYASYYTNNKCKRLRAQQLVKFFTQIGCPVWKIGYDWYDNRILRIESYVTNLRM